MSTKVIVGAQWGDEGKGKIIDILASDSDVVVRSQGGNNAGHTIKYDNKSFTLQSVPSGIFYPSVHCYIGAGVVINPCSLILEMDRLKSENIDISNLKIDNKTHIIMPWHIALDTAEEKYKENQQIGTTKNGIGPCYSDKYKRVGIRMDELIDEDIFKEKAKVLGNYNNKILQQLYGEKALNIDQIIKEYSNYGQKLKPFVDSVTELIANDYHENKKILFEGAQGTMLDINYGTYPFVTSSSPIAGGVCTGVGISPVYIDEVIGVCKAYTTRVGNGPFPSEIKTEQAKIIREKGQEFGSNTKRERRIGWLDTVVLNHSRKINGFSKIVLNKLDILTGLDKIKICTAYKTKDGKVINTFPSCAKHLDELTPIYEELDGFVEDLSEFKNIEELPLNCKKYILRIEELCNLKISMIGVGPKRHQNIYRNF